ncbi:MAG: D-serine deaminase-like pyridoxal phosphate-dependent protein [Limisphaerales bacterium]|jgi:D-serine deaminase-like pyridoxal phosphate-dependent protein
MGDEMTYDRRSFLRHSAKLGSSTLAANLLWSPFARAQAERHGHDDYFAHLNGLLKRQGPGRPVMLLDKRFVDHNIDQIAGSVGGEKQYRIVVKSLPSVPLLKHVMQRSKSNALMVFHQPFLNEVAKTFPMADVLIGKPMPVQAARTFYQQHANNGFNPATQIQWLIDTQERLHQYQALARELGVRMKFNFELDVGLRRGGFDTAEQVAVVLNQVKQDTQHSLFGGLMGYEPQLTGLKAELGHPQVREVLSKYQASIDRVKVAGYDPEKLTLNGAGSHTLKIYERDHTMNDLSAGSGVVMPTDFDTHHLSANLPGLFIATPILKHYPVNPAVPNPPEDMEQLYYIYGGYWKAKMVSPKKIGKPLYESTNQSPITTSSKVDLTVDDYMFMRPTQSEFVMLQFGDLMLIDDGEITEQWPVFHQTG